jgi:hypothetical protein
MSLNCNIEFVHSILLPLTGSGNTQNYLIRIPCQGITFQSGQTPSMISLAVTPNGNGFVRLPNASPSSQFDTAGVTYASYDGNYLYINLTLNFDSTIGVGTTNAVIVNMSISLPITSPSSSARFTISPGVVTQNFASPPSLTIQCADNPSHTITGSNVNVFADVTYPSGSVVTWGLAPSPAPAPRKFLFTQNLTTTPGTPAPTAASGSVQVTITSSN